MGGNAGRVQRTERRTRGRSGHARDILRDVEEKMSLYERTLREARSEGYRLMEQERATALRERQIKLDAVREEISRAIAELKDSINAQVESARATLEVEALHIAAEIGAHILHRPVSPSAISGRSRSSDPAGTKRRRASWIGATLATRS